MWSTTDIAIAVSSVLGAIGAILLGVGFAMRPRTLTILRDSNWKQKDNMSRVFIFLGTLLGVFASLIGGMVIVQEQTAVEGGRGTEGWK